MGNSESQQLLNNIQNQSGYYFKNKDLLIQALTHDSVRVKNPSIPTYQRLEFLGDTVLQFVITNYLFIKYPDLNEGQLTSLRTDLVNGKKQKQIAENLQLEKYINFDQSVRQQSPGNRFNRYDKFVEALIGGIYLDAGGDAEGLAAVKSSIYKMWGLTEPKQTGCVIF